MPESPALRRLAGPQERGELWTADKVSFTLRRGALDFAAWELLVGALVAVGCILAPLSSGVVAYLAVSITLGGGFVLPIALYGWIYRPAFVRITRGELVVHDLVFNREDLVGAGFVHGHIELVLRDGRQWRSRRLSAADPDRLDSLLSSCARGAEAAVGAPNGPHRDVRAVLALAGR